MYTARDYLEGVIMAEVDLVHLAVLGEQQGICGGTGGTFTISERKATCEGCLRENDIKGGAGSTHDDWADNHR
jgi:hypothetical protein